MRLFNLKQSVFAASASMVFACAMADTPQAKDSATPVVVHGATPLPLIAPAWDQGRTYKFGELANYDGWAFRAESGSAHKRPNVNAEDGWEKLNECTDKSKGAVQCELGNQAEVKDTQKDAQREYEKTKQDMTKGKPANRPEG
jgi:hypothetical protein